jgi:general secretion pathway protein N
MKYRPSPRVSSAPSATAATPWRWALGGAFTGLLLAILVFAPARWLAAAVNQASGQQVSLLAPRGSLWQGSAQLVLSGGAGSRNAMALPGQIAWRLRPTWSGAMAHISATCCTQQPLQLTAALVGWDGLRLTLADGQSQWPASLLGGLGTPWNTVQPQGQLVASTRSFHAEWIKGRLSLAGRVQLDATQISSRLSTLKPMGSYRLTLQGGPTASLQLETLEGSLQLTGQGQWVGQRLRFDGAASAAPDRVEALSNLLNIIGRRNGARSIIKVG